MSTNLAQRIASLSPEKRALLERRRRAQTAAQPAKGRIPRRQGKGPWPASTDQAALWFFHQLDPGTAAYNIGNGFRLKGPLNVPLLERSLAAVIDRHEILRTTFEAIDGKPYQVVSPRLELKIPVTDLRHEEDPEATALEEVGRIIRLPFDLAQGPLLRLPLVRIGDQDWVLIGVLHHITTDWWSYNLFFTELFTTYRAFSQGQGDPYPPLPVQFADYAVWRDQWERSEDFKRQEEYWLRQLEDLPTVLEIPADRPRPAKQSFSGAREFFHLPRRLTQGYKALNQQAQTSTAMTLMAFSFATLWRAADRTDLVMGQPVSADREFEDTSRLIGYLLNTLLFRVRIEEDLPFRELLKQVRRVSLEGFANKDLPFRFLVEKLKPERDMSRMPLYQMEFLHVTTESPLLEDGISTDVPDLPDFEVEFFAIDRKTSPVDMQFAFTEGPTDTGYLIEYNTDIFDPPTVQRVGNLLRTLLENILAAPDAPLRDIPLVRPAERRQILGEWSKNGHSAPPAWPLHRFFEEQVKSTPQALAVSAPQHGESLTYAELHHRAGQLAGRLRSLGVGAEQVVGLAVERSPRMLVGMLGILRAGAAYLPLDPKLPSGRLQFMMQDAQATALVTESHLASSLGEAIPSGHDAPVFHLDTLTDAAEGTDFVDPHPQQAAYMIYTSGSTGLPKGVVVEHGNAVQLVDWARRAFRPEELETVLAATSLSFDVSLFELMAPLAVGGSILLVDDLLALGELPEGAQPTLVSAVPSALVGALRTADLPDSVHTVCLAGEALPAELARQLHAIPSVRRVVNLYGPTEGTVYALGWEVPTQQVEPVLIGRPVGTTRAYVLDRHLQPLPPGIPGELWLGGEGVARGYASRPRLTAERFMSDPFAPRPGRRLYRTGDRARYLTDAGEIQFLGRGDGQIKLRGFRIELGEVESALLERPEISEAAVILREDASGEAFLAAYVVTSEALVPATLTEALGHRLPQYMLPTTFTSLPALPRLASGKVDREALPEPQFQVAEEVLNVPPQSHYEKLLAEIWREVLGRGEMGIHSHFFELGGHSLKATQVVARLRQQAGVDIPVRILFEAPTIARLAARLEALEAQHPEDWQPIPTLPRSQPLPLSFAQQRLWFLDQLESDGRTDGTTAEQETEGAQSGGTAAYNMVAGLKLQGNLNISAFRRSLTAIVQRHEALRTTFSKVDGEPRQVISKAAHPALLEIDLSTLPQDQREGEVARRGQQEARRPFNLARGPLLRVQLLKLGPVEHAFLLNMHHIISDGWSIGIFISELSAFYEAFAQSALPQVPELPIQYADFAGWQRGWLEGERLDAHIDSWRQKLEGAPKLLELPTDRPRPALQTFHGGSAPWHLDAATTEKLENLGQGFEATSFMTLLTAFSTLLARLAGKNDLILGTPVAGRDREEVESLIGFFVNTVMMRVQFPGDPTFEDLLRQVRQTALDAFAHQDVPFEKLVEELAPERNRSYSPFFQVMFILQNVPVSELRLPGLSLLPLEVTASTAKFDLSFYVQATDSGLWGHFEYNRDLFDATTIQRLGRQYELLLRALVSSPQTSISRLPLLKAAERHQLVVAWNDTAAPLSSRSVHEGIAARAQQIAERPAVAWEEGEAPPLTYGQLAAQALCLARHLQGLSVGPEDRVAVCLERSQEMVAVLLGIFHAGAAYVPLDPNHPPRRQTYMMEDSRARLLITESSRRALGDEAEVPVLCLDQLDLTAPPPEGPPLPAGDVDRLAYVIYTSGSTGAPKGVQIRHHALLHELENFAKAPGMDAQDVVLALATLAFDIHTIELFLPLLVGARIVVASRATARDGARLRRLLEDGSITPANSTEDSTAPSAPRISVVQATPATWQLLLAAGWRGPGVQALCGGEALSRELAEQVLATGSELWNVYGPTETTVWCARLGVEATELSAPLVSIGRPLDNMQMLVLDQHLTPTPIGIPGELHIAGIGVDRGYLRRPRLTASTFVPDPFAPTEGGRLYKSGDLARFSASGRLEFLGRRDHQVKVRGFRIELGEIEAALLEHPLVARAAVIVHRDEDGQRLVAFLVPEPKADSTNQLEEELRASLLESLPAYMVPSSFVALEELPLNPNGKVDRGALGRKIFKDQPEHHKSTASAAKVAPRDELELRLVGIWQGVLERSEVGVRDDFFALGGHSLLAVRLVDHINQETEQELPVSVLFEHPTIEGLARRLRRGGVATSWSPLVPLQTQGAKAPLFFIHPAGGQVLCFQQLSRLLGTERPFYGLQSQGLMEGQEPLSSVEEMAELYLEALRGKQPQGPYHLGGYSLGGRIAYEMARRLQEQGEEVALLAVVDIYPEDAYTTPAATRPKDQAELYSLLLGGNGVDVSAEELRALPEDELLAVVVEKARQGGIVPPDVRAEEVQRYLRLFEVNLWIEYELGSYDGHLTLFHAAEHPGGEVEALLQAWKERVTSFEAHLLPGDHESLIRLPHVEVLAAGLRGAFERLSES